MTVQEWDMTADRVELDTLRLRLGTQLAAYRKAAGISQPELGAALGKTRSMVSKIEHGRRGMPAKQWEVADDACRAEGALVASHAELAQAEQAYRDRCRARRRTAEARPDLALVSGELAEELMQVVTKLARSLPRREAMQLAKWVLAAVGLTGLNTDGSTRVAQALGSPRRVDGLGKPSRIWQPCSPTASAWRTSSDPPRYWIR